MGEGEREGLGFDGVEGLGVHATERIALTLTLALALTLTLATERVSPSSTTVAPHLVSSVRSA